MAKLNFQGFWSIMQIISSSTTNFRGTATNSLTDKMQQVTKKVAEKIEPLQPYTLWLTAIIHPKPKRPIWKFLLKDAIGLTAMPIILSTSMRTLEINSQMLWGIVLTYEICHLAFKTGHFIAHYNTQTMPYKTTGSLFLITSTFVLLSELLHSLLENIAPSMLGIVLSPALGQVQMVFLGAHTIVVYDQFRFEELPTSVSHTSTFFLSFDTYGRRRAMKRRRRGENATVIDVFP